MINNSNPSKFFCFLALAFAFVCQNSQAAVISFANIQQSLVYVDLSPKENTGFEKGGKILVITKRPRTKNIGKIKDVIGNRLIVEITGGVYNLRPGTKVSIKERKYRKGSGNKALSINRKSSSYKKRRNISAMGDLALSMGDSMFMFGGSAGVSLPFDLELEAHFLIGSLASKTATVEAQYITSHVKRFLTNSLFVYAGGGMRSYTVSTKTPKGTTATSAEGDEDPAAETSDETSLGSEVKVNFSDDIILELGAGVRWQFKTLIIGRSFIAGIDVGYWALASVLSSPPLLNPTLEKEFPLPDGGIFGRAVLGFSF